MNNHFDTMRAAMDEARQVQAAADSQANKMANMLRGRLRKVGSYNLAALKRELRDFNMHTGEWKS